jgi:hypothetical protein
MRFIFSKKSRRIAELERQVESLTEETAALRNLLTYKDHPSTWGGRAAGFYSGPHEIDLNRPLTGVGVDLSIDRREGLFGYWPDKYYGKTVAIRSALDRGYIGPVCDNEDLGLVTRVLRNAGGIDIGMSIDAASKPIANGVYCRVDGKPFNAQALLFDSCEEAQGRGLPITSFDELKETFELADKAINNTP